MYYVYSYKSPSMKYYIGITNNLERRQKDHKKKLINGCSTKFALGLRYHGYDNFSFQCLEIVKNEHEAKKREIYYIEFYDSYKNGYNSTLGGDLSITQGKLTEKQVKEIRKILKEDNLLIREIASNYNVQSSTISEIKNNKRWGHIEGAEVIRRQRGQLKGTQNSQSKLTEEKVREIKTKLMQGVSRKKLEEEYNVAKTNIQKIATGESWSHVEVKGYVYKKVRNGNAKLNKEKVRNIWRDRKKGLTQKQIWEKYGVSKSTVQNIFKGKIWKDIYEEMGGQ